MSNDQILEQTPDAGGMEDLLSDFARGALDRGTELLVETCAAIKSDVAGVVADYETVGGALLESIEPVAMTEGALDAVLAAIDQEPAQDDKTNSATASQKWRGDLDKLPQPLRHHAEEGLQTSSWRLLGRGIRGLDLSFLDPDRSGKIELYRIEPGCSVPRHGHEGGELTLVVSGAFKDETGRYGPGDIAAGGEDVTHQPIAEPGETCLALAVTNAPLKLTGALGLVQRLLGGRTPK